MSNYTRDRGYFAPEKLGPKQSVTPEGFLLCQDVPIARTGTFPYAEGETPVEAVGGVAQVSREADELLRDETLASFEGKPVTIDHPDEFVGPSNWRELAVGVTQNVRRGTGIEDDLMLADLLITDAQAIDEVRKGLREVSNGYEADYEQTAPGRGRQLNIVGNHVALVERGRCGPRCAIGDKEPEAMSEKTKRRTWRDRLMTAFKAKDEEAFAAELKQAEDEMPEEEPEKKQTGDDDVSARVSALEAAVSKLVEALSKPTGDEDPRPGEEKPTGDTVIEAEQAEAVSEEGVKSYTGDTMSRAEILAPGISIPTTDGQKPKARAAAMLAVRRRALDTAFATEAGKKAITPFVGSQSDFSKMSASTIDTAFIGAAELIRIQNNAAGSRTGITTRDFGRTTSVADINTRNAEFWKKPR
ncbi:DUF2213 domain-containing protein [Microvirgula aerodenitrificans]|uniref:DUF2213 domain-containing protein n=1 Tax=Microvirgula aerodenitrificans TaxID=57480 RepID=UPI00248E5A15|nr:DUF2213 domain-containing protein [Microvirgula aerodenitrificans]